MASTSTALPGNRLIEIVFSFDTTGSMSSILDEVRGRLQDMIQRLQSDISGIRIGVIAHGDYCDKDVFYLTKEIDLCQNVAELCQFVQDIEGTGGGDADECYEYVLRMVREKISWTPGSQKILVMIGDANPHEPDYDLNTDNIDWREELKLMKHSGLKVYGVQVHSNESAVDFYTKLASETDGHYLKLTQFSNICDMMLAICYAERGEDFLMNYENEVRSRFGTSRTVPEDIDGMFGTLRRDDSLKSTSSITPSTSVAPVLPQIASIPPAKVARVKPIQRKRKAEASTVNKNKKSKITPLNRKRKIGDLPIDDKKATKKRKNEESKLGLKCREQIPTSEFDKSCGCKEKTKWQLVYTPDENYKVPGFRLRRLSNGNKYWKKIIAFHKMANDSGIYELAVQTKPCKRLQTVYSRVYHSKSTKMRSKDWENVLFQSLWKKSDVMKCIRNVTANKGCRVFLRQLKYSSKLESAVDRTDYAWKHTKKRRVVRNGIQIS